MIVLPAAVTLLSGCWELAVPLIDVGTVGGGAAIAVVEGSDKQPPSTPLERQGGDASTEAAAHPAQPQPLDHESGPIATASPASTPASSLSLTVEPATDARDSHLRHQRQISTQDGARSANAPPPDRRAGPVMTASKLSTTPATLSPKIATAKGSPSAHMSHRRGSITRVFISSAKPQPSDHGIGPVTAALPDNAPPGELPTTIVH